MSGIYIHVPFCKQACSYCDFYFVTRRDKKAAYVQALIREIEETAGTDLAGDEVHTIYFGGGTPSLLESSQVEEILEAVKRIFPADLKEVTFEMNPDDVTPGYLSGLRQAGVTRVSMGIQSTDPELLRFMNRAHSSEEALASLDMIRNSGFDVFTVDLIYGNPGQSLESLQKDLDIILDYNPPHLSAYSLTVESGTRLGKQVELGRITPPGDDTVADHFNLVEEELKKKGILQYEVSNFAVPGKEALHNSSYWGHVNYLGLGPGAHSFWWDKSGEKAMRWSNKTDLNAYLAGDRRDPEEKDILSQEELAEERLMLGLRTRKGLLFSELEKRYGFTFSEKQMHYLQKLTANGKAVLTKEKIHLSRDGLRLADSILLDLITI